MLIPEIPPFKKPQPKPVVNPSPPKIPEIPAFKPRKSKDWEPNQMTASDEHQLQLPTANPEWAKRLKGADTSGIHRSVDCIANKVSDRVIRTICSTFPMIFWIFLLFQAARTDHPNTRSGIVKGSTVMDKCCL